MIDLFLLAREVAIIPNEGIRKECIKQKHIHKEKIEQIQEKNGLHSVGAVLLNPLLSSPRKACYSGLKESEIATLKALPWWSKRSSVLRSAAMKIELRNLMGSSRIPMLTRPRLSALPTEGL